jgi:4-amino-4-deoxy-L-arabinose transferase-like glycosyltransferase
MNGSRLTLQPDRPERARRRVETGPAATRPEAGGAAAPVRGPGWTDRAALGLTAVAALAFLWLALAAARKPYWMDEVLAVWTARRGSVGAVWEALRQGAEFSPPLYHVLLRAILAAGFDDPVILRLPSILAIAVVALAAFVLVRRRFPLPLACLALVFCLSGPLFAFAIQARPYAGVAACFALACTLWDGPAERPVSGPRALGIALLLGLAVGMHFYAILLVAALGLMELVWMLRHRRIRWPVILALAAAAAALLPWLPIMRAASAYNHGDTAAPDYYARPTLARLVGTYVEMAGGDRLLPPVPLAMLLVALGARLLARRRAAARTEDLGIVAGVLCAVPLLVFVFAAVVTGTFNARYVIVTVLGVGLFVAQGVAAHRRGRVIACALIGVAAASLLWTAARPWTFRREAAIDLAALAPAGLPIATGNGLRFFEIYDGADPATRARLTFLQAPDLSRSPDPTNDHQVERWGRIDPALPIAPMDTFLAAHPEFLLYTDAQFPDLVADSLQARGYAATPVVARDGMSLLLVRRPAAGPADPDPGRR